MKTAVTKRYWLRKVGTNLVFQRTAELAKIPDLVAITEEEAKELQAQKQQADRERAERLRMGITAEPEPSKSAAQVALEPPDEGKLPAEAVTVETLRLAALQKRVAEVARLDATELHAIAAGLKLAVSDATPVEDIRAEILATIAADERKPAVEPGDPEAPPTFAPEPSPAEPAADEPAPGNKKGKAKK